MLWSVIAANFAGYRNHANALAVADFDDAAVQREHIVKPRIRGFPHNGIESSFQGVWWRTYGLEEPVLDNLTAGSVLRRLTWFPEELSAGDRWTFPVGATLHLPRQSWVEVHVGCDVQVVHDNAVLNPNGASLANSVVGGYLFVGLRHRETGAELEPDEGRCDLYPQNGVSPPHLDPKKFGIAQELAGGTWDIVLRYAKTTGAEGIYQFSLGRVTMKLEAH